MHSPTAALRPLPSATRHSLRARSFFAHFGAPLLSIALLTAFLTPSRAQAQLQAPKSAAPNSNPEPSPGPSPDLSPKATLGRALFFDTTLSSPAGQSCSSCHSASAGFTFPNSHINEHLGVAPGVIPGRFGFRAVPQISYSVFNPDGPPHYDPVIELFVGGQFWDGHATDLTDQATFPFINPNEMNNLTHNIGDPSLVVQKVATGPSAPAFRAIYGQDIFTRPTNVVYHDVADAIAEYERSDEVSPFSSKYDAWRAGRATLTPSELNGLRIATGSWTGRPDGAGFPRFFHCVECHSIPSIASSGPDLWTNTCYQNIGVPKNPDNPFYTQTDAVHNPAGYNPLGHAFIDYGLGASIYPSMGLPPGNIGPGSNGQGDFLGINGNFKAPSLRNVDRRPNPAFIKAYMHNGVFKSLEQVVHFYNTRNLTTRRGEVIDFTLPHPYQGLRGRPLWDPPEYPNIDTLLNPSGDLGTLPGDGPGGESGAQVGNLGMTPDEEHDVVAFLRTLSDGYFDPASLGTCAITSQPLSQRVCLRGSARITLATNIDGPVSYQWRHNHVPMTGETTTYYTVVVAALADAGTYDCVITAPCATLTSREVTLDVCASDFNCDGQTDNADIQAFFQALIHGDPAADLNGDGVIDHLDVSEFFEALDRHC